MLRRLAILCVIVSTALPIQAASHWTKIESPNFTVYTGGTEKEARETVQFFERVRDFFLLASPVHSTKAVDVRIVVFDDPLEFEEYRPNASAVAFFLAGPGHEFIVMSLAASHDTRSFVHEYMHLVLQHSGLRMPLWLNEGWAEVFASLRPQGKEVFVGDLVPERMDVLKKQTWMEFDALNAVDKQSPSYNDPSQQGIFYAESWALAHMLFLSPEYKDGFGKFVMALNSGKKFPEACQIAYGRSPEKVYADLRTYLARKNLVGTAFDTGENKQDVAIKATPIDDLSVRLLKTELTLAEGKRDQARKEYAKIEREDPDNPELLRAIGSLAVLERDNERALKYFRRAYAGGDADPEMCYELAKLERMARTEGAQVVPILERALKSRPDFPEASTQLGIIKTEMRQFTEAVKIFTAIPSISAADAPGVYCGLTIAQIELGDIPDAQQSLQTCEKWSRTDADIARAKNFARFVNARSDPAAGVHFGEKVFTVTGTLRGLQCNADVKRLAVAVGEKRDKIALFDLPSMDAIEMPSKPQQNVQFQCGDMKPAAIAVEFAAPRVAGEATSGIVRRLLF